MSVRLRARSVLAPYWRSRFAASALRSPLGADSIWVRRSAAGVFQNVGEVAIQLPGTMREVHVATRRTSVALRTLGRLGTSTRTLVVLNQTTKETSPAVPRVHVSAALRFSETSLYG